MTENALFLQPALQQAHDLIDREYAEPLDLAPWPGPAIPVSTSPAVRGRLRRDTAGIPDAPPMERAKTLLRTANLSVTEICFLVGFSSLGSFSARFRELVGRSPSEYRDEAVSRSGARRSRAAS